MTALHPICRLCTSDRPYDSDQDLLAIYQKDGPNEGLYIIDEQLIRDIAQQYNYQMTIRDFDEVVASIRTLVPRKTRCTQRNLIAVNNGIFNYDTKQLMPFSPDYVFLTKSRVNYNPNAVNSVIHNDADGTDWDVESWMNELSDDPDVVQLLWEILGAIIRPFVPWNKAAWFYSETGNNGKGTLCELMRQLCGIGTYASIPLADMGKDFALEPLMKSSCIIVDENDVGTFIDKAANLKAIITNDIVQINRKYKVPIAYRFYGFMVQCLNEYPKVKDKSESFFRRQLFIPFEKCFTGKERRYIKNEYLHRQDVLEYVLFRVLNMNYYELSEPESCKIALQDYKEYNDPVRQFADDILSVANWDLLPFNLLYDTYKEWCARNMPSGKIQNRNSFINDFLAVISQNTEWECTNRKSQHRVGDRMEGYEPLIAIYGLKNWMDPNKAASMTYTLSEKCTPPPGFYKDARIKGITRTSVGMKAKSIRLAYSNDNEDESIG